MGCSFSNYRLPYSPNIEQLDLLSFSTAGGIHSSKTYVVPSTLRMAIIGMFYQDGLTGQPAARYQIGREVLD